MKIKILPYEQAKKAELVARGKYTSDTPYCYGIFDGWPCWGQIVEVDEYFEDTKMCKVNSYYIPSWMYEKCRRINKMMEKIRDILGLEITYKREQLDKPLFVIRSTETNEYLEGCMYCEKTPKWTNQRCCARFFETRTAAMEYLEYYLKEEFIDNCCIKKVED